MVEEADEAVFWLKFAMKSGVENGELSELLGEARELLAIFTASAKTASINYAANRQIANRQ